MPKYSSRDVGIATNMTTRSVQNEMNLAGQSLNRFKDVIDFILIRRIGKLNKRHKVQSFFDGYRKKKISRFKADKSCAKCGGTRQLNLHHIDFDHYNDDSKNKVVLCAKCHLELHRLERQAVLEFYRNRTQNFKDFIKLIYTTP